MTESLPTCAWCKAPGREVRPGFATAEGLGYVEGARVLLERRPRVDRLTGAPRSTLACVDSCACVARQGRRRRIALGLEAA